MEDHTTTGIVTRGLIGVLATAGAVGMSRFSELETGLRLAGLVVGLLIGVTTLWSLWRGPHKPKD